jgi:hypothetical protein
MLTPPQSNVAGVVERHDHRCDCEWCWLGVTNTPPPTPRPSVFARAYFAARQMILAASQRTTGDQG